MYLIVGLALATLVRQLEVFVQLIELQSYAGYREEYVDKISHDAGVERSI
jgi:hypothetical protein